MSSKDHQTMNREHGQSAQLWGTLEELLLACAVNRHGTRKWDSIAMEVQNRSSNLHALTPQDCRDKFLDLKRGFMAKNDNASGSLVPMVDELRRIRVEELRREVERRDVSIVSLEKKVKRLEEERERSSKEEADLNKDLERDGEERKPSPVTVAEKFISRDDSDDAENRSFNESNSKEEIRTEPSLAVVLGESNELWESVDESKREVKDFKEGVVASKQSSDVQSSASLSQKKRRSRGGGGGGAAVSSSGEEPEGDEVSPATKRAWAVKSEPLVKVIGIIRSHRLGLVFERRLRSQESERYKNLIRQHMDLQTVQSRLDKGVYSDYIQKFFRDLLLLFNNGVVFFRKNSPEYVAALELRALVLKEMADMLRKPNHVTVKPEPKQQPDSFSKPNEPSTMVVCRKRSSIKALSENASRREDKRKREVEEKPKLDQKKIDNSLANAEEKNIKKKRIKERSVSVSGRRSSRKNDESGETKHEYGGNELSSHDTLEIKMDKKENAVKKKQGAASFLKRMKQNSPSDTAEDNLDASEDESKDSQGEEEERRRRGRKSTRDGRRRDRVTRSSAGRGAREESGKLKRGNGRPPKRPPESLRASKRGRDGGESEVVVGGVGRARKRSRR